jgi:hypothetical protein
LEEVLHVFKPPIEHGMGVVQGNILFVLCTELRRSQLSLEPVEYVIDACHGDVQHVELVARLRVVLAALEVAGVDLHTLAVLQKLTRHVLTRVRVSAYGGHALKKSQMA